MESRYIEESIDINKWAKEITENILATVGCGEDIEYFGNNVAVCNEDYIDIHENVTGSDIIEFLNHYTPFCRWCLIGWPIFQWGISKRELNEWLPTESDLLASKVRYNLSFVRELVDSNQFENAMTLIRSVEKELKEPPIEPKWNYLTAFCQHNLQINLHDAINRYNVALEHGYYEFWVRYNRGSLHAQLGNIEQARADLLRAVELNPAHEGAKHVLQQMLQRI